MDVGEKYQMEAYRRRRQAIGTDWHPIVGSMMNNVGEMYQKKGAFELAESYFRRGLEIKTQTNAAAKSIVLSEINLANLLTDTARADDALDVLHCSMNRMGKFSGIFEDALSLVHESFGRAFMEKGKYRLAMKSFQEAIGRHGDSCARDFGVIGLQCRLAESLTCLHKYKEVIEIIKISLNQRDAIIKHNPSSMGVLRCYKILRNAQLESECISDAWESYNKGNIEFIRLRNLYENLDYVDGLVKLQVEWNMVKPDDVFSE
jgi:tetratricopeptide (TPR) repeat protein